MSNEVMITAQEMKELNVLPMMFIGNYQVEKLPCMARDDSDEISFKREDMCQERCYSSARIETEIGLCWLGLCKKHWGNLMRKRYSDKKVSNL